MATATDVLARSFRARQVRRAANIAALVSLYYAKKVKLDDPESLERWFKIMLPRILEQHDRSAEEAARFADAIRKIEVDAVDGFRYEPERTINAEQLRTSLRVVGPVAYQKKATEIKRLDISPSVRKSMLTKAQEDTAGNVAGAVLRHVQNGARRTIEHGVQKDQRALGYVRVTRENPCYFCAMLASRGLEYNPYGQDSFDESDARFVGPGDAKVHDSCQCGMKPVYLRDDKILEANKRFEAMWYDLSGQGDADPLTNFRRGYEGRAA